MFINKLPTVQGAFDGQNKHKYLPLSSLYSFCVEQKIKEMNLHLIFYVRS
jgi:hypothetical protein